MIETIVRLLRKLVELLGLLVGRAPALPEPYPECVYPLPILPDGRRARITSRGYWGNSSRPTHKGDDYMYPRQNEPKDHSERWVVPEGTPAIACRAGTVESAGRIGTGWRCWVQHDDGKRSGYFHLKRLLVEEGVKVRAGDPLGIVGDNPKDAGDPRHLHFEVSPADRYVPEDPWDYMKLHGAVHGKVRK